VLNVIAVIAAMQLVLIASILAAALVARLCRMRVSRVSVGLGPPLVVLRSGATRWHLGLVPLGGFLQIAGRDATDEVVSNDDPSAFQNRHVLLRVLPSLAIPVTFSLFAGIVTAASYAIWGIPGPAQHAEIRQVIPGSSAERGGLADGDVVIAIDGNPVPAAEVRQMIRASGGKPFEITVRRADSILHREITPELVDGIARIGIQLARPETFEQVSVVKAIAEGFQFPVEYGQLVFGALGELFSGEAQVEAGGPVRIVDEFRVQGAVRHFVGFVAILCAYLGIALALPLPPYPGYKALLILCGWRSRRRRPEQEARALGQVPAPDVAFPAALLAVHAVLGFLLIWSIVQGPVLSLHSLELGTAALAVSTVLATIGLARGWPRVWILLVNVLLLDIWGSLVNAGMGNRLAASMSGIGLTLVMLAVLALPSVRRWFHQECPACHTLGARPVWSRRRAFGCIRCGSCWTE
jgi:regulator of sigma E protease